MKTSTVIYQPAQLDPTLLVVFSGLLLFVNPKSHLILTALSILLDPITWHIHLSVPANCIKLLV